MFFDQSVFDGRLKMFGGEITEHEREEIAAFQEALKRTQTQ
jgi:hypothetical protein